MPARKENVTRSSASFPVTRWSLVHSAGDEGGAALEELCLSYWKPLYGFLRHSGYSRADSEDLTQSFFVRILHRGSLPREDQVKGRLRSYFLGALKRHLADDLRSKNALKRGGGRDHVSMGALEFDFEQAEGEWSQASSQQSGLEEFFDQRWASEVLSKAYERVFRRYDRLDKREEYEALRAGLVGAGELDLPRVASLLRVKVDSVRVLLSRLRRHFRAAIQDEVLQTVATPEDLEAELAYLIGVFESS